MHREVDLPQAGRRLVGRTALAVLAGFGSMALVLPADVRLAYLTCLALVLGPWLVIGVRGAERSCLEVQCALHALTERLRSMAGKTAAVAELEPILSLDELGELSLRFASIQQQFQEALERLRQVRQRAEALDRSKNQWLDALRHELRTPLNAILGFTEILLSEMDGPLTAMQREDLRIIQTAGSHLRDLFNDVLDVSAAAAGRLSLEWTAVRADELLREVANEIGNQIGNRPIRLHIDIAAPMLPFLADRRRLRQVLSNLAGNAVKFTESGTVTLQASASDGEVHLMVRDTGSGIAQQEISLIFQEFQQSIDERRRRRGHGLGLAISRQLVELHGGRLSVQSRLGHGSTFCVSLPQKAPPP